MLLLICLSINTNGRASSYKQWNFVSSKYFFIPLFSLSESDVFLLSLWKSVNHCNDNSFAISVMWIELEEVHNSCATLTVNFFYGVCVTNLLFLFTGLSLLCVSGFIEGSFCNDKLLRCCTV
jgi:hypothetical protein